MKTRREVIRLLLSLVTGTGAFFSRLGSGIRVAMADTRRRLLNKDTPLETLIAEEPSGLDTSQKNTGFRCDWWPRTFMAHDGLNM